MSIEIKHRDTYKPLFIICQHPNSLLVIAAVWVLINLHLSDHVQLDKTVRLPYNFTHDDNLSPET